MKILAKLEKSREIWFLITASLIFFFLRFPSLFEPDWYGDEGIYQTLGIGIRAGRLLYRDIFDNKPPLLYLLYSFVDSDQFMIRLLSLIFGLLSVIVFFYLCKRLFQNAKTSFIATLIFAVLFGLPLIEGNIANAENFMLLLNISAGYLILKSLDTKIQDIKYKILFFAGLVLGLSFLLKIVAIFDFAAFAGFLFFANYSKKLLDIFKVEHLLKEIKNLAPFLIGFLMPITLTAIYFIFNHASKDFLAATLFSNVGYVGYGNQLIIPQGFLIFKLILLGSFSLFVFWKRKTYGLSFAFVSLWLGFSLFNAYFSQRPYTHYVLVLLPALCLTVGLFILNRNFSKLAGVLMLSVFIAVLLSFNFYTKTIFYYQNFAAFMLNKQSVTAYERFFDQSTPRDYEIANFINLYAKTSDNLFLWGNNAQVYKMTNKLPPGKYAAAYHITSYKDGLSNTKAGLVINKPKFIVIMPNVSIFPFSLAGYDRKINIGGVDIYERFY
ncbi:MAG TPA: glycosyltransferase family 39 protein [Patescibacteria group bacterium]|jgi:hypothetical protein|nr:glycosyltransferase family 39 protein [Patescibacteria group bacterium]